MRSRLLVLGAAILFSTGGAAVKSCTLTAWQVACLRSTLAAVALALVFPSWRRGWSPATLGVGTAYAATMILFVTGNKLTTAANTIFLQSTAPIYLLLLGPWLLRERIARSEWLLTGWIAVGMSLLFLGTEAPSATAPDPMRGNVLAAFSGLTWAATLLGLRALGRDAGGAATVAGRAVVAGNAIAGLVALPLALPIAGIGTADLVIVSYLGIIQIGLAYIWLTFGVREIGALEASLLLLLEPVLSSIWAWWIHGERPGNLALAGSGLILLASVGRVVFGAGARGAKGRATRRRQ